MKCLVRKDKDIDMDKKLKNKYGILVLIALFCILIVIYLKVAEQNKYVRIYCIQNEGKSYSVVKNAFCGEWEVLYSESMEGESTGYMKKGDVINISEDEIKIDDDLLSDIYFDSTLTTFLKGGEYDKFFKEYGYTCSFFEWMQGKNYYLYTLVLNSKQQLAFCMAEADSMIIRYGESVYYCKKLVSEGNNNAKYFSGLCRMHDVGLDGGEVYEGKWIIDQIVAMKGIKKISKIKSMLDKEIYFYRPDLGKLRITYNGEMYRKISVRMDIITWQENQIFDEYGRFEELGVTEYLIPYVQFDLSNTDIEQIKGILVINTEKILLVTEDAIYSCIR